MIRRKLNPILQTVNGGSGPSNSRSARTWGWLLIWVLVPLVLWFSLRDISLEAILESLGRLNVQSIFILAVLNILIFLLFSSRWWLILRAQGYPQPYLSLSGYRLAAFGITYFTPGTQLGGEPLQIYLLHRRGGVPTTTALASVTLEKVLELLANFTFLLVGISTILVTGVIGSPAGMKLLLLPVGLLFLPIGYLIALRSGKQPFTWLIRFFSRRFPASSRLRNASQTIALAEFQSVQFCASHPRTLLMASLFSLVIWILKVLEFGLTLHFLGLQLPLPLIITILTAARLAYLMPFPAGLGSLEASQVMAFGLIGINPAVGISLSLLIRARDVILGVSGLWLGGLYGSKVMAASKSNSMRSP